MQTNDVIERRKRVAIFAGLYAVSLVLLFFIFSAFGFHVETADKKDAASRQDGTQVADENLFRADSILHARLRQWQQASDVYTMLREDSSSAVQQSNAAALMDTCEMAFRETVDSVAALNEFKDEKNYAANALINSFKAIVAEKNGSKDLGSINAEDMDRADNRLVVEDLRMQLKKKDEELKRLQSAGKMPLLQPVANNHEVTDALNAEIERLKTSFNDVESEYNEAKEKYNNVKAENSRLTAQLVEYKKNLALTTTSNNLAADTKINALQQKVTDLNAEMGFAIVDCNLARADAQQLISNARQRKQLLQESLAMLQNLSASGDARIQERAKQKIVHLNHIATTLHD